MNLSTEEYVNLLKADSTAPGTSQEQEKNRCKPQLSNDPARSELHLAIGRIIDTEAKDASYTRTIHRQQRELPSPDMTPLLV